MRQTKKRRQCQNQAGIARRALAAGAAIAAGTQAYAEPIRFDNAAHGEPGHFHWWDDHLDITIDAVSQSGTGGIKFHQYLVTYYGQRDHGTFYSLVQAEPGIAGVGVAVNSSYPFRMLTPLVSTEPIPATESLFHSYGKVFDIYYSYYNPDNSFSLLPEGEDTYLGVRINLDSQWHYGWIGVRRVGYYGSELEGFAWGYETEAGVPIAAGAVPEPGTLAMLALGFVAAGTRRRQRNG